MATPSITTAHGLATSLVEGRAVAFPARRGPFRRHLVIGDPQTTFERFAAVLDANGCLSDEGWLADDVSLLSIGDHFDFKLPDGLSYDDGGREGEKILRWLAAHEEEQAPILMGNHDVCRVGELFRFTDERFAQAREEATAVLRLEGAARDEAEAALLAKHPDLPTAEIAARDFCCFQVRQRELLQDLLLRRRVRLAWAGHLDDGTEVLLTHATVTVRELGLLGLGETAAASTVAERLNAFLDERTTRVEQVWREGGEKPLDLHLLHLHGGRGGPDGGSGEGGGLLYHRPSLEPTKGWAGERRRRYHPRELPAGLVQVAGHTQHKKMCEELGGNPDEGRGRVRTLRVDEGKPVYTVGRIPVGEGAVLYQVDGGMNDGDPAAYELFALAGWRSEGRWSAGRRSAGRGSAGRRSAG